MGQPTRGHVAAAVLAISMLTGCSQPKAPEAVAETTDVVPATATIAPRPVEPETRTLRVTYVDNVPLDLYFNLDDEECYTRAATRAGEEAGLGAPQVVVRDGSGNILAVGEVPMVGGNNTKNACEIPLRIEDVPVSDIHEITISGTDMSIRGERTDVEETVLVQDEGHSVVNVTISG